MCRKIRGGRRHSRQAIKLKADQNSFSAPKMIHLVIFCFFRFRPKMEFHFRLRPKVKKNASSVGLYIKLFHITPYVNDFQTLNNPAS